MTSTLVTETSTLSRERAAAAGWPGRGGAPRAWAPRFLRERRSRRREARTDTECLQQGSSDRKQSPGRSGLFPARAKLPKNTSCFVPEIQQNSASGTASGCRSGKRKRARSGIQNANATASRARGRRCWSLAAAWPDGLRQDPRAAGDQEGERVLQGEAVRRGARPLTRKPQRLDPGETKLNKFIGLAYMGWYQPGSKHPKDLEFAPKAIENLDDVREGVPARTRRPASSSSRCSSRRTVTTTPSTSTRRCLKADPKDSKAMSRSPRCTSRRATSTKGVEWLKKRADMEPNNPEG